MTTYTEGDIKITPTRGTRIRKFDDHESHGLTHCMKAVDFILEQRDRVLFVEIKDPDNPQAAPADREKFIEGFTSEKMDQELVYKCRDSFLYEWASGRLQKPVHYLVLIAVGHLTKADLLTRTEAMKRKLPVLDYTQGRWKKAPFSGCAVFNMETWNERITYCSVRRASEI